MLNARITAALRELMAAKAASAVITSDYLAALNEVTSRTARNDLKELDGLLRKNGAALQSIRGTGYTLQITDDQQFHRWVQYIFQEQEPQAVPDAPEDRLQYVLQRLLLADGYVKLEDLADELYISRSTVQNDLRDVKRLLQAYGIVLEKRPNYGLRVKGEEVRLRYCMSEHLFNRKKAAAVTQAPLAILPPADMAVIHAIIMEEIRRSHITMSDIALNNLVIHIAIACKRIRDGNHVVMYPQELKHITEQAEYGVAARIIIEVEEKLGVVFPETEIAYIAIHLLGTKLMTDTDVPEDELEQLIGPDIVQLVEELLTVIEEKLRPGIAHDRELSAGLCLHLKPALNRYRYGMNLRNPMLDAIKANYPVAFETAVLAGTVLQQKTGLHVEENEIGYLALHFGAALERRKLQHAPKRCMIVCASGVGSARLVYYKLQATFGRDLDIIGTTEYYKLSQIPFDQLDFLISTIPIAEPLPVPVITVNTILCSSDLAKVQQALREEQAELQYTREELVFLQQKLDSKEEVLRFLADKLQSLGLVGPGYLESVLERESISPTAFGNLVAIPHPMTPHTSETFWTVCTLQKPIQWKDKQVQFVCLLNVERNSSADLQNMYKLLVRVVEDAALVQQLIKCKTYKEFTRVFLK